MNKEILQVKFLKKLHHLKRAIDPRRHPGKTIYITFDTNKNGKGTYSLFNYSKIPESHINKTPPSVPLSSREAHSRFLSTSKLFTTLTVMSFSLVSWKQNIWLPSFCLDHAFLSNPKIEYVTSLRNWKKNGYHPYLILCPTSPHN